MHPTLIDRTDMSLGRKLKEQSAAREMEKHYTKDQILEAYLNQIAFGHGWYGVESAARHYFGKSASKLSLAEAAALAAMPKSALSTIPSGIPIGCANGAISSSARWLSSDSSRPRKRPPRSDRR